jgi:hypothetical protein
MSLGDYHGLDYNMDYHCVHGSINPDEYRVLLKMHYIIISPNSEYYESLIKNSNVEWTRLSRNMMKMSADPKNLQEYFASGLVNTSRLIRNNIMFVVTMILILLIIYLD